MKANGCEDVAGGERPTLGPGLQSAAAGQNRGWCVCVWKVWLVAVSHHHKAVNHPPTSSYTNTQIGFIITCPPFPACQSIRMRREHKVAATGLGGRWDTGRGVVRNGRAMNSHVRSPPSPSFWHLAGPLKGDSRSLGLAAYLRRIHIILSHPAHQRGSVRQWARLMHCE